MNHPPALQSMSTPVMMSLSVKEKDHIRLVFLGAAGVGKTALIQRFLQDTFDPKHRRTVEELHSTEYETPEGIAITVEILDTTGSYEFPAMRKLSMRNGDAFVLVYSVESQDTFDAVQRLREEILDVKEDKCPPMVVVGNKKDNSGTQKVFREDVVGIVELEWNSCLLETSAKDNLHVTEIFKELLGKVNMSIQLSPALRKRRETIPNGQNWRPPMSKTNSCSIC